MVETQLISRGIRDPRVLEAMSRIPRHQFVPSDLQDLAYDDGPLPIGEGQTISQPYIVALMTELLELTGRENILEIGTGSGYQTAILCQLARKVYTIELHANLSDTAFSRISDQGHDNFQTRVADGHFGWPDAAPFEGVIITAAPDKIPTALYPQITPSGRMVVPVGRFVQDLLLITNCREKEPDVHSILPVRFVAMQK